MTKCFTPSKAFKYVTTISKYTVAGNVGHSLELEELLEKVAVPAIEGGKHGCCPCSCPLHRFGVAGKAAWWHQYPGVQSAPGQPTTL